MEVFPQFADGTLGSAVATPTANSNKVRIGRLNGDASLDVAGVGWGTNTVSVLLNDGSGRLRAPVTHAAQHGRYDDLETADGRDDLVVMSGQLYAVPNISVLAQLPGRWVRRGGRAPHRHEHPHARDRCRRRHRRRAERRRCELRRQQAVLTGRGPRPDAGRNTRRTEELLELRRPGAGRRGGRIGGSGLALMCFGT